MDQPADGRRHGTCCGLASGARETHSFVSAREQMDSANGTVREPDRQTDRRAELTYSRGFARADPKRLSAETTGGHSFEFERSELKPIWKHEAA